MSRVRGRRSPSGGIGLAAGSAFRSRKPNANARNRRFPVELHAEGVCGGLRGPSGRRFHFPRWWIPDDVIRTLPAGPILSGSSDALRRGGAIPSALLPGRSLCGAPLHPQVLPAGHGHQRQREDLSVLQQGLCGGRPARKWIGGRRRRYADPRRRNGASLSQWNIRPPPRYLRRRRSVLHPAQRAAESTALHLRGIRHQRLLHRQFLLRQLFGTIACNNNSVSSYIAAICICTVTVTVE